MSRFNWIKNVEFIGSLKRRGVINTLKIVYMTLEDYLFDIRYGINTAGVIQLDNLEIDSKNKNNGVRYEPTKAKPFRKLIKIINLPKESTFIDFGCGKGKVLIMASEYGFKKIIGIEFSPQLYNDAHKNMDIYKKRRDHNSQIEIIEDDVVNYEIKDDDAIFFFFNPFNETVMSKILKNITDSIKRNNRKIWLIYHNTKCCEIFDEHNYLYKTGEYLLNGSEYDFLVYENK